MSKLKEKGFANFKNFDKEAIREKLDEMLAEGKITQEKYDAIISGECKPSFDGKKFPTFQHKKAAGAIDITECCVLDQHRQRHHLFPLYRKL